MKSFLNQNGANCHFCSPLEHHKQPWQLTITKLRFEKPLPIILVMFTRPQCYPPILIGVSARINFVCQIRRWNIPIFFFVLPEKFFYLISILYRSLTSFGSSIVNIEFLKVEMASFSFIFLESSINLVVFP